MKMLMLMVILLTLGACASPHIQTKCEALANRKGMFVCEDP